MKIFPVVFCVTTLFVVTIHGAFQPDVQTSQKWTKRAIDDKKNMDKLAIAISKNVPLSQVFLYKLKEAISPAVKVKPGNCNPADKLNQMAFLLKSMSDVLAKLGFNYQMLLIQDFANYLYILNNHIIGAYDPDYKNKIILQVPTPNGDYKKLLESFRNFESEFDKAYKEYFVCVETATINESFPSEFGKFIAFVGATVEAGFKASNPKEAQEFATGTKNFKEVMDNLSPTIVKTKSAAALKVLTAIATSSEARKGWLTILIEDFERVLPAEIPQAVAENPHHTEENEESSSNVDILRNLMKFLRMR